MQPISPATTATPPPPRPVAVVDAWGGHTRPQSLHFAIFFACIAWYRVATTLASSAANGFAVRFDMGNEQPVFEALALLFLVLLGLSALRLMERTLVPLGVSLGLPKRSTSSEEWGIGAALGWGISVVTVLAMLLGRSLHVQFWTTPRAFWLLLLAAAALAIGTVAKLLALYGYGFQHLVEGAGRVRATITLVAIVMLDAIWAPTAFGTGSGTRIMVSMFGALLLCLCWLRTRGLWIGWGAWFGWAASTALVFGLPIGGYGPLSAVVDAAALGPAWLTGGDYGPSASFLLLLLLIAAIPLLIRITDEYAWRYTRKPLVPAGIPVDIAPPAAHVAMEEAPTAPPPSLVQIQPITPVPVREDVASN
ncbi:MAG TPA: CPBP family intramembrane glutamate endopeptidase [Acidobacteriaceae bacterium]|nr:CPBP family intramembrane glutamate endopeptidase [Acidobacteriaceae bacterium]